MLAGYKTTPAEEIISDHGHGAKQSQSKSQGQGQGRPGNGKTISEPQKKLIYAKSKAKNVSEADIKKAFGVYDISHLKMDQMNAVINFIENGVMPAGGTEPAAPEGCPRDVATCGSAELNGDMKTVCAVNNGAPCPFANV